jgi:hypothetical protein
MAAESDNDSTFLPGRRLCPDGSCIGIIGHDGKCTVCGTSGAGGSTAQAPSASDAPHEADVEADFEPDFEATEHSPENSASGFDPNRRLCVDDTCVGVIGEDNRCRICGKPAAA